MTSATMLHTQATNGAAPEQVALDMVWVEWLDSRRPVGEWQWLDELPAPEPVGCSTLGYLIHEDSDVVVLAQTLADWKPPARREADDRAQVSGVITIPVRSILNREQVSFILD